MDFYSGIILKAIGIPTSMFTVIFAVGRTVGWIAHWNEMISGSYRIGRPRQLYTGYAKRDFVRWTSARLHWISERPPSGLFYSRQRRDQRMELHHARHRYQRNRPLHPAESISNDELVDSFNAYVESIMLNTPSRSLLESWQPCSPPPRIYRKGLGYQIPLCNEQGRHHRPKPLVPRLPERPNEAQSIQCEMAVAAALKPWSRQGRQRQDIDAVIVAASNMQRAYPAMAVEVQDALGIKGLALT